MPAAYFLIPYLVFAGLSVMLFFFNIFHIAKFGLQSTRTAFVLGLYTLGFFSVGIISVILIAQYDWTATLDLAEIFNTSISGVPSL